jgi:hypothetical protein
VIKDLLGVIPYRIDNTTGLKYALTAEPRLLSLLVIHTDTCRIHSLIIILSAARQHVELSASRTISVLLLSCIMAEPLHTNELGECDITIHDKLPKCNNFYPR